MGDLDYLNELSNKDLHKKCLQLGLPNVPITDSTRPTMLRKLRATILGEGTKKTNIPKSKARQTISSATYSQVNAANNNKGRRTITATSSPKRLINRKIELATTLSGSDMDSPSEEEDNRNGLCSVSNTTKSKTLSTNANVLPRSLSLSKSGVLTTSYTQEITPSQTYHEPNTSSVNAQYSILNSRRPGAGHGEAVIPNKKIVFDQQYEKNLNSFTPQLTRTQLNSTSYNAYDAFNYPNNNNNVERHTFSGSTAPFAYNRNTTTNPQVAQSSIDAQRYAFGASRATAVPYSRSPELQRRTYASALMSDRNVPAEYCSPQLQRPTFPSSGQTATLYPKLNEFYAEENAVKTDEYDTDEEDIAPIEAPYFSKFARTLEDVKRNAVLKPQGRRGLELHEPSVKETFIQFCYILDQKYHLKHTFILISILIIAIFIYSLFAP